MKLGRGRCPFRRTLPRFLFRTNCHREKGLA